MNVECDSETTLPARPRAPFAPVVLDRRRRWYKGDFHVHSTESGDASATLDQIVALARSRGLDFVNLSDHNTDSQLPLAVALADRWRELAGPACERLVFPGGHFFLRSSRDAALAAIMQRLRPPAC